MTEFAAEEGARYARQLSLPEVGEAGQARLRSASVLVVGCGGLGSPAATYLAAGGVGTLGLIDGDRVELSNLQRQFLHGTADVGRPKVDSAAERLHELNPHTRLRLFDHHLEAGNAGLLSEFDFIVEATDSYPSKFLVADSCHAARKPYCHGGIRAFFGQVLTVLPGQTACFRCIFEAAPSHNEAPRGPLGAVAGVIGAIQAAEALRFLLGRGHLLTDRLLTFDGLRMTFRSIPVKRNRACALCHD